MLVQGTLNGASTVYTIHPISSYSFGAVVPLHNMMDCVTWCDYNHLLMIILIFRLLK